VAGWPELKRRRSRYPSDLTDEDWSSFEPLMPPRSAKGRNRKTDLREVVNVIRYMV